MVDLTPIPLWRHPDLSFADKILNLIMYLISPLASVPRDPTAVLRGRKGLSKYSALGFDNEISSKNGWKQTVLKVPRGDGTELEVLLITRAEKRVDGKLDPLVLYFHGGAYTVGTNKDAHVAPLLGRLVNEFGTRAAYASVDYRLAPEHIAPAAADDCELAFQFLSSHTEIAAAHGFDNTRIHIWGPSAGAGLALVLGAAMCRRGERSRVASVFADSPMLHPP